MIVLATMFGADNARLDDAGNTLVGVQVVFIGTGSPPFLSEVEVQVDLTQDINQIQSAIAAGIRAFATTQGWTIPANGINIMDWKKG